MKKNIFTLGVASMAALLALSGEQALAQSSNEITTQVEQQDDDEKKKDGFFRRAFRDMKESARLQRQIDRANYEATKLESKAFYQEQKRKSNPKVRTAAERERMEQELKAAEQRREEAQERLDSIRNSK
jgi:hypothetical protein